MKLLEDGGDGAKGAVLEIIRAEEFWTRVCEGHLKRVRKSEIASLLLPNCKTVKKNLPLIASIPNFMCFAKCVCVRGGRVIDTGKKGMNVISGSSFYSTCIDCHRSLYHLTQLNYANWMAQ